MHIATEPSGVLADEGSTILAMGEKLERVPSSSDLSVIWINWSVLYPLRGWFSCSLSAHCWMRRKRKRFLQKLQQLDAVYDFYPAHARLLQKVHPQLPIESFPIGLYAGPPKVPVPNVQDCDFDVCVVGSRSPRRNRLWAALERAGLRLSPTQGPFEELICRSRLVLNVHQHRSDNCEAHRILSALAHARVVVSEPILALGECLEPRWVITANYRQIPTVVQETLADLDRLKHMSDGAFNYYWNEFWPAARDWWQNMVRKWARLDIDHPTLVPEKRRAMT